MKCWFLVLLLIVSVSGLVDAKEPPDMVSIPNQRGTVIFPHKSHADTIGNCRRCHDRKGGKIQGLGKKWAHKVCKGCHLALLAGPVTCDRCHVSKKGAPSDGSGSIY